MRSHFGLLATLTISPPIAPSIYASLFDHLKSCPDTYHIVVIINRSTDQMIAHGTVVKENKFIHGGSAAGHIEDIVVSPDVRGRGLGLKLVKGLRDMATTTLGCYKVILDCKEDRVRKWSSLTKRPALTGRLAQRFTRNADSIFGLERWYVLKFGLNANPHQSYYRSTADVTPSLSPALNPSIPTPNIPSPLDRDHLALPGMIHTTIPRAEEHDVPTDRSSPKTFASASSGSGVTYHYPIGAPAPEHPAWTVDRLANSEIKSASSASSSPKSLRFGLASEERVMSPLPPGAAPPVMTNEPDKLFHEL